MVEELTDAQLEELHDDLVTLREELRAELENAKGASKPVELDQAAFGRVSRIDAIQQQSMVSAYKERVTTRLRLIDAALDAYARDEYGYCRLCEEPVGFRRLKARPETPMCLRCQSEREKR